MANLRNKFCDDLSSPMTLRGYFSKRSRPAESAWRACAAAWIYSAHRSRRYGGIGFRRCRAWTDGRHSESRGLLALRTDSVFLVLIREAPDQIGCSRCLVLGGGF